MITCLRTCILLATGLMVSLSAKADDAKVIRIGFFPNVTHAQALYLKLNSTIEKATGAKVVWYQFNAGPSAMEAMFAGSLDATYVGPSPTINAYSKPEGKMFRVIAGAASGGTGLVVRGDSGIEKDSDFEGKVIATPQLGNTQDVAARNWFIGRGIGLRERGGKVSLIPLANPDQLMMFQRKEIDGAWTVEPWVSRLLQEAGGKLYLDEKTLWKDGRYVTTHLIATDSFLKKNGDLAKALVLAHVEATIALNNDKKAAVKDLNEQLKRETGKMIPDSITSSALERLELTWDPIQSSLSENAKAARKIGFLGKDADIGGLYDLTVLNSVLQDKGLEKINTSVANDS